MPLLVDWDQDWRVVGSGERVVVQATWVDPELEGAPTLRVTGRAEGVPMEPDPEGEPHLWIASPVVIRSPRFFPATTTLTVESATDESNSVSTLGFRKLTLLPRWSVITTIGVVAVSIIVVFLQLAHIIGTFEWTKFETGLGLSAGTLLILGAYVRRRFNEASAVSRLPIFGLGTHLIWTTVAAAVVIAFLSPPLDRAVTSYMVRGALVEVVNRTPATVELHVSTDNQLELPPGETATFLRVPPHRYEVDELASRLSERDRFCVTDVHAECPVQEESGASDTCALLSEATTGSRPSDPRLDDKCEAQILQDGLQSVFLGRDPIDPLVPRHIVVDCRPRRWYCLRSPDCAEEETCLKANSCRGSSPAESGDPLCVPLDDECDLPEEATIALKGDGFELGADSRLVVRYAPDGACPEPDDWVTLGVDAPEMAEIGIWIGAERDDGTIEASTFSLRGSERRWVPFARSEKYFDVTLSEGADGPKSQLSCAGSEAFTLTPIENASPAIADFSAFGPSGRSSWTRGDNSSHAWVCLEGETTAFSEGVAGVFPTPEPLAARGIELPRDLALKRIRVEAAGDRRHTLGWVNRSSTDPQELTCAELRVDPGSAWGRKAVRTLVLYDGKQELARWQSAAGARISLHRRDAGTSLPWACWPTGIEVDSLRVRAEFSGATRTRNLKLRADPGTSSNGHIRQLVISDEVLCYLTRSTGAVAYTPCSNPGRTTSREQRREINSERGMACTKVYQCD